MSLASVDPWDAAGYPLVEDHPYDDPPQQPAAPVLAFEGLADMLARVDAAGPPAWLLRGIWPYDAYGVLAAEDKAGKSWAACDVAVAVASGTPWLHAYDVDLPGPVLLLAGEGGARNLARRLRAVAGGRGLDAEALALRVCERVPHLTNPAHLEALADELHAHPPRLVILDPLYLAARGASGAPTSTRWAKHSKACSTPARPHAPPCSSSPTSTKTARAAATGASPASVPARGAASSSPLTSSTATPTAPA